MAMTIQELREKRKKVWDTARDFLDSKRNANGVLSEEDSKTYDAMEQTIVDLGKEIQRLERQAVPAVRQRLDPNGAGFRFRRGAGTHCFLRCLDRPEFNLFRR